MISFTNRLREIGRKILETKKLSAEGLNQAFKDATEKNILECFLQGLLPSISQRIGQHHNVNSLIKEAIQIEKQFEAQAALRHNPIRNKSVYTCQLCKKEGHEANNCRTNNKSCAICKKPGHLSDQCYFRNKSNSNLVKPQICQLCNKLGHTASNCHLVNRCQMCNKIGHTAKDCTLHKSTSSATSITCQLCDRKGHKASDCRSQKPSQPKPVCKYCKGEGHTLEECRKRQYYNSKHSGNASRAPQMSGNKEPSAQTRSLNTAQVDDLTSELLPLN